MGTKDIFGKIFKLIRPQGYIAGNILFKKMFKLISKENDNSQSGSGGGGGGGGGGIIEPRPKGR